MFIGKIREAPNIRVKGVYGTSQAVGIGVIKFDIKDKEGNITTITLKNIIYLPESTKNLISISRWDKNKQDGCIIMRRGEYSIFF